MASLGLTNRLIVALRLGRSGDLKRPTGKPGGTPQAPATRFPSRINQTPRREDGSTSSPLGDADGREPWPRIRERGRKTSGPVRPLEEEAQRARGSLPKKELGPSRLSTRVRIQP